MPASPPSSWLLSLVLIALVVLSCASSPELSSPARQARGISSGSESGSGSGVGRDGLGDMLRQCAVGFVRKNIWVTNSMKQRDTCRSRGFQHRSTLMQSWKTANLKSEGSYSLARSLFHKHILEHNDNDGYEGKRKELGVPIQNIVFLGDSVSSQLAQFLICDLLRDIEHSHDTQASSFLESLSLLPHPVRSIIKDSAVNSSYLSDKVVRSFNRTVASFVVPLSDSTFGYLRIHNEQFNLPCVHNNRSGKCFHPKERSVFDFVSHLLASYSPLLSSSPTHTLLIFNYGLHIHRNFAWIMEPMLSALLTHAKSLRRDSGSVIFRETSSQSFTGSPGGYFKYDMSPISPQSFCCSLPYPVLSPHALEWRNRLALKTLRELDVLWNHHIHWLPFFNTSSILWDMRAEWNEQTNLPDCTHFVYSPFVYRSLWGDIQHILMTT